MRRHYLLALASSASLALLAAAGCSSSDDGGGAGPSPDASTTPDSSTLPDDASTPDGGSKPEAGPHEPGWDPSFSLPGVAGRVNPTLNAIARIANRQIALAGNFEQAGSIPTKFVALWNGDKWLSISTGLPDAIDKMVATPTGELYGTTFVNGISTLYKWNKTAWSKVVELDGKVTSLDIAPDGTLYAAGWFTHVGTQSIATLAKLSGGTWSEVSGAPQGLDVVRVVGAKICVGGRFDPWNTENRVGVQCLEGGTWSDKPLPENANGHINDIGEQNGQLVAAGQFVLEQFDSAGSLARWDGSKWNLIGGGLEGLGPGEVMDMEIYGDKIFVCGQFGFAGGTQVSHVAMWDTTQGRWSSLNDGIYGNSGGATIGAPAEVLALDQGGELYVGGRFSMIGGRNALGIARWDGNQWNPVDDPKAKRLGVNGGVQALVEAPNGAVYVGGYFPLVGGDVAANNIARLENGSWASLGLGLDRPVSTIAVNGTTVYAGGDFLHSGAIVTKYVAQWNGSSWAGLGTGFDGAVKTLVVGPDGNLYAGGEFTQAGSTVVNHIAKWNGTTWQAIGEGFNAGVNAIAFDASGKLHAGGTFTKSGSADVNHIAAWNGTSWSTVGAGVNGPRYEFGDGEYGGSVDAIVFYDGKLTVGGSFDRSGATENAPMVGNPAAWNGTAWVSVGGGAQYSFGSPTISTLSVRGNELYIGGFFDHAGPVTDAGAPFGKIAMWNGTSWSNLGGGVSDAMSVILADKDGFWVGGGFTFAGNQGSYNIGRFWFN